MIRRLIALAFVTVPFAATAQVTAVVGGTVHTMGPEGTLDNATILVRDGRIVAVGPGVTVPDGSRIIDAAGKIVTPGLFTPAGQIGLVEVGSSAGPNDAVQRGETFTASFDVADAFNPRSTLIAVNRIEGITRAAVLPQAAAPDDAGISHVISGLAAVVNLSGGGDSIDRRAAAMVVNLGELGAGLAGESRVQALRQLRSALDDARDFRDHGDAWERGQHRDYGYSAADLQALQRVLDREIPLLVHVDRASDIEALLDMAGDYGLRLVIEGGVEAWIVADALAAARVPVILGQEDNLPSNFDRLNASERNASMLVNAGVTIAFADSSATTHNARNITQAAGNAVVEGLSHEQAMRAITRNPAEIYGVADELGSIEPGKQADLVIWPGDPLELVNYPDAVIIRGQHMDMQSRQTRLRDRYLDVDTARPPAYRGAAGQDP